MSPYCRRCGGYLADEPSFCPECGYEQDTPASHQEIGDKGREAARRLADRAINVSGQHKDLLCQRCEAMMDHVSVNVPIREFGVPYIGAPALIEGPVFPFSPAPPFLLP